MSRASASFSGVSKGGPDAGTDEKLHGLGHVSHALKNPEEAERQGNEAKKAKTIEEYEASESEQYADNFAREAKENEPDPPPEE